MKTRAFLLAVTLVLCGCDAKPPAKSAQPQAEPAEKTAAAAMPAAPAPEAKPVEHQVTGKITRLDDGAYPMFTLTIQPATGDAVSLDLNAEAVDLGGQEISNFKPGQSVAVTWRSSQKPDLDDMRLNGRSVLGSDAPKKADPAWKSITGKLEGAEAVSGGDLPDHVTVTDAGGKKVTFELFINEEMVPANGKTVTALYDMRSDDRVTSMRKQ